MGHDRVIAKYVLALSQVWDPELKNRLEKRTGCRFVNIMDRSGLTTEKLEFVRPEYVFFPHWSHMIPKEIYSRFQCVIFHMADVPFGRGGSPLQNLIVRGIYDTKISALKCEKGLDAGPVYLKRNLSLHGNAEEIYIRATRIIEDMIVEMVETSPRPVAQEGTVVLFERRKPEDGDLSNLDSLEKIYDYIRMLDAEGYPRAFIETDAFCLRFSRATRKKNEIRADVSITLKDPAD